MGGRGLMPTIRPDKSIPELIKHIKHSFRESEYDEVQKTLIEREKNMKIEIGNLMRDRDLLKKDIDLLENTQSYTELEKCSVEEKLGMSQRRCARNCVEEKLENCNRKCKEMDERLLKMGREIENLTRDKFDANQTVKELKWEESDADQKIRILMREKLGVEEKLENSNRKCEEMDERLLRMGKETEELRREKFDANRTIEELKLKEIEADQAVQELNCKNVEASQTIDELRVQKMESDNAAEVYKRIVGDSYKKILKLETRLSKMLSVNVEDFPNLVNATDNCAATCTALEKEENVNVLNFVEGGSDSLENGTVNADGDAMSPKVCETCDYSPGSGGIGLSKKGGINLAHPGTKEDGTNVVCTFSCSVPAYNSDVSENSGTIPNNGGQEPEVEGTKLY
ncbi:hypothetical protein C2S51_005710 [Perilla frutescens var. frutescens]|nr:hypothetical protein C2S51_005710 [Perilla frutescens var. frutescens]